MMNEMDRLLKAKKCAVNVAMVVLAVAVNKPTLWDDSQRPVLQALVLSLAPNFFFEKRGSYSFYCLFYRPQNFRVFPLCLLGLRL